MPGKRPPAGAGAPDNAPCKVSFPNGQAGGKHQPPHESEPEAAASRCVVVMAAPRLPLRQFSSGAAVQRNMHKETLS